MEGDDKDVVNADGEAEADKNAESATAQSDNSNAGGTSSKRPRLSRAVKELLINNNNEFMNNFDPESSNREKRKLTRKFTLEAILPIKSLLKQHQLSMDCIQKKNGSIYDENGILSATQKDICDCLIEDCPGCHFPCPKCRSCKCGIECRINRKWAYEVIENEGELSLRTNNPIPTT